MRCTSRQRRAAAFGLLVGGIAVAGVVPACSEVAGTEPDPGPNVVWVVWDTVRADHLSLYGHDRPTTPFLEEWARDARVYNDCLSTASSTVPSHASMFTGLLPSEHGMHNRHKHLEDHFETIAELFHEAGYATYLFAANPHISSDENFQQGFDVEEHPWDPAYRDEALSIVRSKITPEDRSSELPDKVRAMTLSPWDIKACGELARRGVESWLDGRDPAQPFFIFLNYMEAHRPFIPPASFREKMMTPEQLEKSYLVDRSWVPMWSYTFGLHEYTGEELDLMAATYDACLAELDALFRDLVAMLETRIDLDDTIIVLTADHGEHLGEHHMLDHQYSLYNPLIRVPLVVRYPEKFAPGRDDGPVVTYDLFPTLLELAGIDPPPGHRSQAMSLLSTKPDRARVAEYPSPFPGPFGAVLSAHPDWDPSPWLRVLRTYHLNDYKYIWASDGRHELYNEREDRGELHNLIDERNDLHLDLNTGLEDFVAQLSPPATTTQSMPRMSEETRRRLEALGYLGGGEPSAPADEQESDWPTLPMPPGR